MLEQDRLCAYLADTLDPAERARVEAELATDRAAQRQLADQQLMDQALRVALGGAAADARVKQSVLAVLRASPTEQFKSGVLQETLAAPWPRRQGWLSFFNSLGWARRWMKLAAIWRQAAGLARRAWLVPVGATALLAVIGVGVFLFSKGQMPQRIEIGKFTAVMGAPTIQPAGKRTPHHASRAAAVHLGDRIETGDADKAEIQFHDGTTLRLNFNTALEIPKPESPNRPLGTSMTREAAQRGVGDRQSGGPRSNASTFQRPREINLLAGHIWAKVHKATNAPQFAVRTPVATAAVKGTQFGLKLQRAVAPTNSPSVSRPPSSALPLMAVLTVQEGRVEFSNGFGTVEATDLTESVATANAAPTAPRRVASLKTFWITTTSALVLSTSRPSLPEAGGRLVYRGGWAGLAAADVAVGMSGQGATAPVIPEQVRVVRVQRNSPAERAGLRVGDVIVALNGRAITNAWEVTAAFFKQAGNPITLTLASQPSPRPVTLTTTAAPDAPPLPPFSRRAWMALEAASRWLLERRSGEGERALGQLLRGEAGAAAHNNLGLLYETREQSAQALAHYQQAVAVAPQVALYHFNYGLALQNIGNLERAAEELELASSLAPSWDEAFESLAGIYSPLDRHADALRAVDAALSLNPQSPDLWVSKGSVLADQGHPQEARQALLRALELEPSYAAACRELGDLCHHEDQLEEAQRLLRRATELDPSDHHAFNALGNVYTDQARYAEAEQALRQAIRLDPANAIAYSNLGYCYRKRGQPDEAEKLYQKAIALDPDSPIPYSNLGELYRRLGRLDEAERMLRMGIELDPQNMAAINNLGGLYHYNRRQFDAAEKIYRRVIELDPTYFYAFHNLGNLFVDRGNLDEAEKMYRKAIELVGDKPEAALTWVSLGKLQEKRGDTGAAIQAYGKALSLKPGFTEAADALKRLGQ